MKVDSSTQLGANAMAGVLGITARRLQQLVKEGHVGRVQSGRYELGPTVRDYLAFSQASKSEEAIDFYLQRARKMRAEADRIELELATQRREYIHATHVERILERFASEAAASFEAAPGRIRNRIPHLSSKEIDIIKTVLAGTRNAVANLKPS